LLDHGIDAVRISVYLLSKCLWPLSPLFLAFLRAVVSRGAGLLFRGAQPTLRFLDLSEVLFQRLFQHLQAILLAEVELPDLFPRLLVVKERHFNMGAV